MTTLSSREFNQDVSRAKREARQAPVFITDRGKPSHVLLSFSAYEALTRESLSLIDLLAMKDVEAPMGELDDPFADWDKR